MICGLHIENIAVVKSLDIDLACGFNVLTGETGAGKSIIIDSLSLLLGARADKELIRRGETTATVCATFSDIGDGAQALLGEMGFSVEEGMLMLSRTIAVDGKSTARLDGRVITLSMLREISAALFNIHGQNDNQTLLRASSHIGILDRFASCDRLLSEYSSLYREVLHLRTELDSLNRDSMEKERLREMLSYQVEDIDAANLKTGEEEKLVDEARRLEGLERVNKCTSLVHRAILGSDKGAGASYLCDRAATALAQISDSFPEAKELSERLVSVKYELEDIAESAERLAEIDEADPTARLDKIGARLEVITKLKRKYGATVEDVLSFRDDAAAKLEALDNSEARAEELALALAVAEKKAKSVADKLYEMRRDAAKELQAKVTESLEFLDMPKVRFEVGIDHGDTLGANGTDKVEFLIATNAGEPLMPMIKIASGGELARIMLSLRSVLNACDGTGTVIFDEIDTGISGKTSRKVGIKLAGIGKDTQVICVTHSAQIASLADSHFFISKAEVDGRVETSLRLLSREERVDEIARILGGINITDIQREAAREMIEEGRAL